MGKYNLWLEWEAYKMAHPEARQVLEWQEQDYRRFCECPQNVERKGGNRNGHVPKSQNREDLQAHERGLSENSSQRKRGF